MTELEVVALLGPPLKVTYDEVQHLRTSWYAKPGPRTPWYPMLWVHFRDDRVGYVYGKRYIWFGYDDEGVYVLSSGGASEARNFEATFLR